MNRFNTNKKTKTKWEDMNKAADVSLWWLGSVYGRG